MFVRKIFAGAIHVFKKSKLSYDRDQRFATPTDYFPCCFDVPVKPSVEALKKSNHHQVL